MYEAYEMIYRVTSYKFGVKLWEKTCPSITALTDCVHFSMFFKLNRIASKKTTVEKYSLKFTCTDTSDNTIHVKNITNVMLTYSDQRLIYKMLEKNGFVDHKWLRINKGEKIAK